MKQFYKIKSVKEGKRDLKNKGSIRLICLLKADMNEYILEIIYFKFIFFLIKFLASKFK